MPCFLILPNQLYKAAFRAEKGTEFVLLECGSLRKKRPSMQAAVFERASLQAFRERLLVKGFIVHYVPHNECDDFPHFLQTLVTKGLPQIFLYDKAPTFLTSIAKESGGVVTYIPIPGSLTLTKNWYTKEPQDDLHLEKKHSQPPPRFQLEYDRYVEEAITYVRAEIPTLRTAREPRAGFAATHADAEEILSYAATYVVPNYPAAKQDEAGIFIRQWLRPVLKAGLLTAEQVVKAIRQSQATSQAQVAFLADIKGSLAGLRT